MKKSIFIFFIVLLICLLFFGFRRQRVKIEHIKSKGVLVIFYDNGTKELYNITNNGIYVTYNYTFFNLRKNIKNRVNLSPCFRLRGNFSTIPGDVLLMKINLTPTCIERLDKLLGRRPNGYGCVELYKKGKYIEISCKNLTIRMYLSST